MIINFFFWQHTVPGKKLDKISLILIIVYQKQVCQEYFSIRLKSNEYYFNFSRDISILFTEKKSNIFSAQLIRR